MKKIIAILFVVCFTLSHTVVSAIQEKKTVNNNVNNVEENNDWFYYPSFENYALNGMPDFDQKQDNWKDPWYHGFSFCGPTSLANIIWYLDSMYSNPQGTVGDGADTFSMVQDYNAPSNPDPGPSTDDHSYNNVNDLATPWDQENSEFGNEFIEKLAWYCDTNGCRTESGEFGTSVTNMRSGFLMWISEKGLDSYFDVEIFSIHSGTQDISKLPDDVSCLKNDDSVQDDFTFEMLASRVESGEFAALLIFIYDHYGNALYGHWVTVAGVSSSQQQIEISDPYVDVTNPTYDYTLHNDAAIVSHDLYEINSTIPFPHDGLWCLEDYETNCYTVVASVVLIAPNNDIIITNPKTGFLSIFNKGIVPTILGSTIVIGSISLQTVINNNCGEIEKVEFYLNEELQTTDTEAPYIWDWKKLSFRRHTIGITAHNNYGNSTISEFNIWKFL